MSSLNNLRASSAVLPLLIFSGAVAIGCTASPREHVGQVTADVDVAPPQRPAPLCRDPVIKDIACRYVGYQKGTLVPGEPTVTKTGSGKFVDITYTQGCKFTIAVMDDIGGYCAIDQVADPGQRVCDATAEKVISVSSYGGTEVLPITPATVLADLKLLCEGVPRIVGDSRPGKGACCPRPPTPPNLDPIPPIPFRLVPIEPIPFNPIQIDPIPFVPVPAQPTPVQPPADPPGDAGAGSADAGAGSADAGGGSAEAGGSADAM